MSDPACWCVYKITFSDGDESEYGLLGHGTKEECERIADIIPAIAYNGGRPNPVCHVAIVEAKP